MIDLIEVAERSEKGLRMSEKDWDFALFRKMEELKRRHHMKYCGPDVLEVQDEYADRAFEAAVDFLAEMGVYCVTTNTVIHFSKEEILEAARMAPPEIIIGEGKDARKILARDYEDKRPPNTRGNGHCPYPYSLGWQVLRCFAKIPRTDLVEGYNFTSVNGREIHGLPLEVYAMRREAALMREAVRSAGRAGLSITLYPISTRSGALISAMDPENGIRRSDGILLSILPEIKVESDMIAAAIAYEEYGSYKVNGGGFSLIGGYCGGPEGAIVEVIAKILAAWLVYRDSIHYSVAVEGYLTRRGTSLVTVAPAETSEKAPPRWTTLVPANALRRNSNIIRWGAIVGGRIHGGGIGSISSYLAQAGAAIGATVFGLHLGGGATPFEESFGCEVSDATIKANIRRKEVPDLLERLDKKIGQYLKTERYPSPEAPRERRMMAYIDFEQYFKPMTEMYDFVGGAPTQKALENCKKAKKELHELGLPLPT